uniref:Uncharacterized protein n=1 Tax=Anatid alphaherpesvirus 2 TaxID=3080522 RepID=A0AAU0K8H7_9ALPH
MNSEPFIEYEDGEEEARQREDYDAEGQNEDRENADGHVNGNEGQVFGTTVDASTVVVYSTAGPSPDKIVCSDASIAEAKQTIESFIASVERTYDSELASEALDVLIKGCAYSAQLKAVVEAMETTNKMTRIASASHAKRAAAFAAESATLSRMVARTLTAASNAVLLGSCLTFGCGMLFGIKAAKSRIATPALLFALGIVAGKMR